MGLSENVVYPIVPNGWWSLSLLNGYFIGNIPNIFRHTHIIRRVCHQILAKDETDSVSHDPGELLFLHLAIFRQCVTVALRKRISDNDIRQLGSLVSLGSPNCEWMICTLAMEVAPQKNSVLPGTWLYCTMAGSIFSDCSTSTAKWWFCVNPSDCRYDPAWMSQWYYLQSHNKNPWYPHDFVGYTSHIYIYKTQERYESIRLTLANLSASRKFGQLVRKLVTDGMPIDAREARLPLHGQVQNGWRVFASSAFLGWDDNLIDTLCSSSVH